VPAALFLTNPPEAQHRARLTQQAPVLRGVIGVQQVFGAADLTYDDYILFSTLSWREPKGGKIPLTYGYLGTVRYVGEKTDR
jgi:hypothetical protein